MIKHRFIILLIAFCSVSTYLAGVSHAQLGPKDGNKLAAKDLERVKVGQPAPDFTLEDTNGNAISLSSFQNRKSVVLVFYRGHW